jgi:hypothetical protein
LTEVQRAMLHAQCGVGEASAEAAFAVDIISPAWLSWLVAFVRTIIFQWKPV